MSRCAEALCAEALALVLADGQWHESDEVKATLAEAGWSKRTTQRAAAELGVEIERLGFPSSTRWRLSNGAAEPVPPVAPDVGVDATDLDLGYFADRWRVPRELAAEFVEGFVEKGIAVVAGGRLALTPKGHRLARDVAGGLYPQESDAA